MEAEFLRPDADHPPPVKKDDSKHDSVEHNFCGEAEAWRMVSMCQGYGMLLKLARLIHTLLNRPETPDADQLGSNTDNEKVGKSQCIEDNDGVLKRGNHRHSCV